MVVTCPDGAELDLALAEARSRKPALRRSGDLRHAVAEATSVDLARPLPFLRSVVGLSRTH
jgi:hypothetical protein